MGTLKSVSNAAEDGGGILDAEFGRLLKAIDSEMRAASKGFYHELNPAESETYQALKKRPAKDQADLARYMFKNRQKAFTGREKVNGIWMGRTPRGVELFRGLMRANLPILPEELLSWVIDMKGDRDQSGPRRMLTPVRFSEWPIGWMIQQVERKAIKAPLSDEALRMLREIRAWPEMDEARGYYGTDFGKVKIRIDALLAAADGVDLAIAPYKKLGGDAFGDALKIQLAALQPEETGNWHRIFNHAASANGARPGKAFLSTAKELRETLGKEWVRRHMQHWFQHAVSAKIIERNRSETYGGQTSNWIEQTAFTQSNGVLLKGLVWMCEGFRDSKTVNLIADLCEKSMKKLPGVGPAAQATANACLLYLENTPGTEATARLSRLSTAIKQKNVQKRVHEIVAKKAEQAGITTIQLEERIVPTYGLENGTKTVAFDDYSLRIEVEGPGKVSQTWLKPDGSPQKSKPKAVAEKAALKTLHGKITTEVATLKKILSAQRDRIDRMLAEDIEWPLEEVMRYYVGHDLVGTIARRLIWSLSTGDIVTSAIFHDEGWQDVTGTPVPVDEATNARLWHPVDCPVDEVMAWRARLGALGIVQPCKQAYREVYLLTNAERTTEVYSNRMAAHMLKQHQMATLMAARGWRYQLMGWYDDGLDDQFASKTFVTSSLRAEFLIHTNWDSENWNDAGIYFYVGTDQLRFVGEDGLPVRLETVPRRLLSETMRDADLFVGVASVGNDPAWFDQGPTPAARNYWESYSFGNLDLFAETRKDVLQSLLPRLKIRNIAHIDGNYLIVEGKLNVYKIHLRSSNILMLPGNRYLCIVPGGVPKAGQVALPFEGDSRLLVILSKAMMLAEDDKITDSDIVSQLKR